MNLTMAEGQAVGLCALARADGLPDIGILRTAVAQLHPESCGWCDYPVAELDAMLRAFRPMAREIAAWWSLPNRARGEAIRMAQAA